VHKSMCLFSMATLGAAHNLSCRRAVSSFQYHKNRNFSFEFPIPQKTKLWSLRSGLLLSCGGLSTHFRAAEAVLQAADRALPGANSSRLTAARLGIAHKRALHRGDLQQVGTK
jgi:hypothetical protein